MIWILLLFQWAYWWTGQELIYLILFIYTSNHLFFHQIFFLMEIFMYFFLYISKYHLIMKSFWILPWGHKGYLNRDDSMSWTVKPNISFHSLFICIYVAGVYMKHKRKITKIKENSKLKGNSSLSKNFSSKRSKICFI